MTTSCSYLVVDYIVSDKKTRSIRGHAVEIIGVRETGNPQVSKTLRSEFNSRGPCQNKRSQLAQLVEQRIVNPWVGGSSPSLGAKIRLI